MITPQVQVETVPQVQVPGVVQMTVPTQVQAQNTNIQQQISPQISTIQQVSVPGVVQTYPNQPQLQPLQQAGNTVLEID